jgi:hypothetical protein
LCFGVTNPGSFLVLGFFVIPSAVSLLLEFYHEWSLELLLGDVTGVCDLDLMCGYCFTIPFWRDQTRNTPESVAQFKAVGLRELSTLICMFSINRAVVPLRTFFYAKVSESILERMMCIKATSYGIESHVL